MDIFETFGTVWNSLNILQDSSGNPMQQFLVVIFLAITATLILNKENTKYLYLTMFMFIGFFVIISPNPIYFYILIPLAVLANIQAVSSVYNKISSQLSDVIGRIKKE